MCSPTNAAIESAFGIEPEDVPRFHEPAVSLAGATGGSEYCLRVSEQLAAYLDQVIERRRQDPREDLTESHCEVEDPDDVIRYRLHLRARPAALSPRDQAESVVAQDPPLLIGRQVGDHLLEFARFGQALGVRIV